MNLSAMHKVAEKVFLLQFDYECTLRWGHQNISPEPQGDIKVKWFSISAQK